jgi:hypothetical protein
MVTLGTRLRELARHRTGIIVSIGLALLVSGISATGFSFFPPGLHAHASQPAGEHTQILVDDHKVSVLRSGFDVASFNNLHEGAMLAATLLAQDPARDYVGRLAGIPVSAIQFSAPQTVMDPPLAPWPPSRYTVVVAARPSVPILDVYAQAPSQAAAKRLVDAVAPALNQVLAGPGNFLLSVTQLGPGASVDTGGGGTLMQALEMFAGVLALGCGATVMLARARGDWRPRATLGARRGMPFPSNGAPVR